MSNPNAKSVDGWDANLVKDVTSPSVGALGILYIATGISYPLLLGISILGGTVSFFFAYGVFPFLAILITFLFGIWTLLTFFWLTFNIKRISALRKTWVVVLVWTSLALGILPLIVWFYIDGASELEKLLF